MSDVVTLTQDLIRRPSVTPLDADCQQVLGARLEALGFTVEHLRYEDVDNLWAVWGTSGPLCLFAGHTDVVPTGPLEDWSVEPFAAEIRDGYLYGRGAADMKGSLAAMVVACEHLLGSGDFGDPNRAPLRIGFLITSDEEGPAINGTVKVVEWLQQQGIAPDYCIVGEPSSANTLGDTVRNGRRGSLGARMIVHGKQGHVAYPQQADNPIHALAAPLQALTSTVWDQGNDYYPATSLQVSNLTSGTGATNVIPGSAELLFNFRFCTEQTPATLQRRVADILSEFELRYEIDWTLSGLPFLTERGTLTEAVTAAIQSVCGVTTELSTSGGTSDGRFIAPLGTQLIELGPCNATIHKIDECVKVADLEPLAEIYRRILLNLAALCDEASSP